MWGCWRKSAITDGFIRGMVVPLLVATASLQVHVLLSVKLGSVIAIRLG